MRRPYKPYVAQTIGELNEQLGWMMLNAPTFKDRTGYFPERSIDTAFQGLKDSLANLRGKLGEGRYAKMLDMADQMRALFGSDPENKTGGSKAGRLIIREMELMLRRKKAAAPE
jgi:hypothetical protein